MKWNHLSIPKLHRWSLGMGKWFHPILYRACAYLSMLIHVSKRAPGYKQYKENETVVHILWDMLYMQMDMLCRTHLGWIMIWLPMHPGVICYLVSVTRSDNTAAITYTLHIGLKWTPCSNLLRKNFYHFNSLVPGRYCYNLKCNFQRCYTE